MHRILVIGAVDSTLLTLRQLAKHGFDIVGVLGHEPANPQAVSGLADLKAEAAQLGLPYRGFRHINEADPIAWAQAKQPDIIFAVGFSQLLAESWLQMPKLGCVGFHPTKLPQGRGRAALAWIVLEEQYGSATFFLMGAGADDGPIFVQEVFAVDAEDDANSIKNKVSAAIVKALDAWLPQLKKGEWNPIPQDETKASWYGKRSPADGLIDWGQSAWNIDRLIKAATTPYPGAYTYFKDTKLTIWTSAIETTIPIKGAVGRILLLCKERGHLIQTGDGLLWLKKTDLPPEMKMGVGDKLGYNAQDEIFKIKTILKQYEQNFGNSSPR